ncbi:HTH_Tnp_Tc3_2 domain-containing protein [Trichonephila clavipes]|nr:HTH_Tnp_Tc3_2 domain-containing protein [Trichonephila clavipes]
MPPDRQRPDQGPRNSSCLRARIFMPVISCTLEHDTGESTIWLVSTPNFGGGHLWVVRSVPPLFPFNQPYKRIRCPTCIYSTPIPRSRRHGGGRVRSTTPAEDRYIVLSAKRNRRTTVQQVANQFLAASGKQISRKTVARRLRGGGLYARRPIECVPLTRQHRTARLQWCREHHN